MPTLHLVCGKIAAGKSTLTAALGAAPGTVVISEDAWLAALFGDQVQSPADYRRLSATLRGAMAPHVADLLGAGLSVVLDFPANTVETRAWMRGLIAATGAAHVMHVLEVPDAVCLARLRARRAAGTHPFTVSDAVFHQITAHYAPPMPDEGFTLRRHRHPGRKDDGPEG